jgi:PAS domain S-box-containing protein
LKTSTQRQGAIFGNSGAELIGGNIELLMPETYRREHDGYIGTYVARGVKKIIGIGREVSGRRKDGSIFPLHLSVTSRRTTGATLRG